MSKFTKVFPKGKAFLPVIHVATVAQAKRNAAIAFQEGADGIFLISHDADVNASVLRAIYHEVRNVFTKEWIGINFLDMEPEETIPFAFPSVSGLWHDNIGITDDPRSTQRASAIATLFDAWQQEYMCEALHFGSVAFKYQDAVKDPAAAAEIAMPYTDVITTSGSATSEAPNLEKIVAMREATGGFPLAIASGVTAQNVGTFLPYADCFLVASSIGSSFTEFDPYKVRAFVKALGR